MIHVTDQQAIRRVALEFSVNPTTFFGATAMRHSFTMPAALALLGAIGVGQTALNAHAQQVVPYNAPPGLVPQQQTAVPSGAPDPIVSSRQERARLGVALSDNSQGKVWIRSIEPNSGADEAGLRANDQILALDEQKINTYLDVVRYVNQKGASDDVVVYILRNGRRGMLTASLGSEYAGATTGQVTEYPGNVRQRSFAPPAPPPVPQRPPGYVVPNTLGPYNR
jgi:membrane-associated protease RseP (regulator of RpoE activity)